MKLASIKKFVSLFLVFVLFSSCATLPPPGTAMTEDQRREAKNRCIAQYTVSSALGGAILGAAIGALTGGGRGAAKGAIIGGVTGGVIGFAAAWNHCISLFSNLETYPVADYKQTALDMNYQPSQGDLVQIKDLAISPPTITPGGTVSLTGKYIVMNADPNAKDIKVVIERGVGGFDEKTKTFKEPSRFEPTEKTIDATNRTNKLDGQFDLPDKVPAGKYKIIVRITALGKTVTEGAEVEVVKGANQGNQEKKASSAPQGEKALSAAPAKPDNAPVSPAAQAKPAPAAPAVATAAAAGADKAAGAKGLSGTEKTAQPATLKEAREAKQNQDLDGALFQDKSSKVWYLENEDGTYKLKDGKFVLIHGN
jgi:hypothetical protein